MKKIRKAVVTTAGYGTRFLPATKAVPKVMLPIVDKPVVQYLVEELVEAGIEQIILVTSWNTRAVEDHFDRHLELEHKLKETGKTEQLDQIRRLSEMAEFVYVRQKEQRGNGDAVLTAKNIVGNEPFVTLWGDDLFTATPNRVTQLIKAYEKYNATILGGLVTDKPEDTRKYGYAKGEQLEEGIMKVSDLVEKPGPESAPSNLAIVGGYVFSPEIFDALENFQPEEGKELVWVDGVNALRGKGQDVYAIEIKNSNFYDCGNILGYLKTNVEIALSRKDTQDEFAKFIRETAEKLN